MIKLFEIRDSATFIPAMAVRLTAVHNTQEYWLLRRAGYSSEQITMLGEGTELRCPTCEYTIGAKLAEHLINKFPSGFHCLNIGHSGVLMEPMPGIKVLDGEPYIILVKLDGVEAQYDPYSWGRSRTMGEAHRYIVANWASLESGQVVDVEFILGECTAPKQSERVTVG